MESQKKVNPLAIVFFVLAGIFLIVVPLITWAQFKNNMPHAYLWTFGEWLGSYFGEIFVRSGLPAIICAVVGVVFLKKPPKKQAMNNATLKSEPASNADELKKYKALLDDGAITQEEFDAKKKELLGL